MVENWGDQIAGVPSAGRAARYETAVKPCN